MAQVHRSSGVNTERFEQLDVDEDVYSDLGSSIASEDTSLACSVRDHVYENGRRYHSLNAGTYVIPNDETEQLRLDMYHHTTSLILHGALHVVELPLKLDRILDLGTGTGTWAINMADSHPDAHVIGVDLSPVPPSWAPPNCTFEVDDIEKPWIWKESSFDFIHSANLAQGIRDWPTYTKRIYDHLTPGGVAQLFESETVFQSHDNTVPKGGNIEKYQAAFKTAAELAGLQEVTHKLESYLEDAGFVDIRVVIKKMILGPWPKDPKKKEIGKWGLAITEQGLMSYGLSLFTRQLGMSTEEAMRLCDGAFEELCKRGVHTYCALWFVEGRKPTDGEGQTESMVL